VVSSGSEVLFVSEPDEKTALWSGPFLSAEEAGKLSGIMDVRPSGELDRYLTGELKHHQSVYLNHDPSLTGDRRRGRSSEWWDRLAGMQEGPELKPLGPLLARLRMVKEPEEVGAIRKACEIAESGLRRVLSVLRPGVMEYELEAQLAAAFTGRGCRGHAFEPIVASGNNALILHYVLNRDVCRDGEMVLMDFGPELNCYGADCTRTLPVNGRFSPRQREVYDAVYRVFLSARAMMAPGITMADFHREVGRLLEEEHLRLGLYTEDEARSQPPDQPLRKRYFMHGVTHSLGLDVHDPFEKQEAFRPGMVLACEPAMYIREEGIGIRLENDILITENGSEDLMEDIPMKASEIELIMEQNAARQ